MAHEALLRRPSPVGVRGVVLLGLGLAAVWSYSVLGLDLSDLIPGQGGLELVKRFFSRAITPALRSEAQYVPDGTPPLLFTAAHAAWQTLLFAGAAMSLAIPLGLLLGFLASSAWWAADSAQPGTLLPGRIRRAIAPVIYVGSRTLIALLRSIHEIIWAVLLLSAFGLSNFAAVLAIALPFSGVLAKIFSEMIDESPREPAHALRGAGAGPLQVFLFGLLPGALPDMVAYTFYRFECALRSSAILGFFGYPTLGYHIRQAFRSTDYGEVWTFLYALLLLVLLFEWWSGALRRRVVAR